MSYKARRTLPCGFNVVIEDPVKVSFRGGCPALRTFFQPPQRTQCNDRLAKKYVTPASLKMSQVVDLCSGQ